MKINGTDRYALQGMAMAGKDKGSGNIDELIKSLREQMDAVNGNEKYSDDIKKAKSDQLQKQIEELENMKKAREAEALKPKERKNTRTKKYTQRNSHGDTYLSEEDAKAMISADLSKEKRMIYSRSKASMSAHAQMLTNEIEQDRGRAGGSMSGVSDFKTKLLDKLKSGIEGLTKGIYDELGEINRRHRETLAKKSEEASEVETEKQEDVEDIENENKSVQVVAE